MNCAGQCVIISTLYHNQSAEIQLFVFSYWGFIKVLFFVPAIILSIPFNRTESLATAAAGPSGLHSKLGSEQSIWNRLLSEISRRLPIRHHWVTRAHSVLVRSHVLHSAHKAGVFIHWQQSSLVSNSLFRRTATTNPLNTGHLHWNHHEIKIFKFCRRNSPAPCCRKNLLYDHHVYANWLLLVVLITSIACEAEHRKAHLQVLIHRFPKLHLIGVIHSREDKGIEANVDAPKSLVCAGLAPLFVALFHAWSREESPVPCRNDSPARLRLNNSINQEATIFCSDCRFLSSMLRSVLRSQK